MYDGGCCQSVMLLLWSFPKWVLAVSHMELNPYLAQYRAASIDSTKTVVAIVCSMLIDQAITLWSELSIATSVLDLPPMSTLASARAAGVGRYSAAAIVVSLVSSVKVSRRLTLILMLVFFMYGFCDLGIAWESCA